MKAAFSIWEDRIAPVFDTSQFIQIVEVEKNCVLDKKNESLNEEVALQKLMRLANLQINTLICGAIARQTYLTASMHGISVIPFIAGGVDEVITAWLNGKLSVKNFAMPGCWNRGSNRKFQGLDNFYNEESSMNGQGCGGRGRGTGRGGGMGKGGGQGMGQGRGRQNLSVNEGIYDTCECPKCGHREPHDRGMPCFQKQCPKCGSNMIRANN